MPLSSQALYTHLCMNSDDDGVVEAFNVLKITGAAEDDLRILNAKGFIKILNEDYITYIINWSAHDGIRADRMIPSQYRDLLIQIIPNIKLKAPQKRSDIKYLDSQPEKISASLDSPWTVHGQAVDRTPLATEKEKEKEKEKYPSKEGSPLIDLKYLGIAKDFQKLKLTTHPELKAVKEASLEKWANEIKKLVEIDKKTIPDIEKVLSFALSTNFWVNNLLSLNQLREKNPNGIMKFETIQAQYLQKQGRKTKWD